MSQRFFDVSVDVLTRDIQCGDFIIAEHTNGWGWSHVNYGRTGRPHSDAGGDCASLYDCLVAIDAWQQQELAA